MPLRRSATVLGFAFTRSGTIPLSASLRISRNATTDGTGQQAVFNVNVQYGAVLALNHLTIQNGGQATIDHENGILLVTNSLISGSSVSSFRTGSGTTSVTNTTLANNGVGVGASGGSTVTTSATISTSQTSISSAGGSVSVASTIGASAAGADCAG